MKKIIYFFTISILIFQSCSPDNDSDTAIDDNDSLIGKWFLVSSTYEGKIYPHTGCSNGNRDYILFSEPNIYRHYVYPSYNDCDYILAESSTWIKKGVKITIDSDIYNTEIWTIDELTATTLKLVSDDGAYYVYSSY